MDHNSWQSSFRHGHKFLLGLQYNRNFHRFSHDHRCKREHVHCFAECDNSSPSNLCKLHCLDQPNNWRSSNLPCIRFRRHGWILVQLELWRQHKRNRKPRLAHLHNSWVPHSHADRHRFKHDPDNHHADHNSLSACPCAPLNQLYNEFDIRTSRTTSHLLSNCKWGDLSLRILVELWRLVSLDRKPGLPQFRRGELHCYSDGYGQFCSQPNGCCLPTPHNHHVPTYLACCQFSDCQRELSTHFQCISDWRSVTNNQYCLRQLP